MSTFFPVTLAGWLIATRAGLSVVDRLDILIWRWVRRSRRSRGR